MKTGSDIASFVSKLNFSEKDYSQGKERALLLSILESSLIHNVEVLSS